MRIRPAAVEDREAILRIYNHAVEHTTATADLQPQTVQSRAEWFATRHALLVAEEAGAVLGWGALNPYHARPGYRFTVEDSLYVAPDAQGRGVGGALLAVLLDEARRLGMHAVLAGIDGDNAASRRVHERAGFVEVARFRELVRKFERWLDVVYLELLL